MSLSQPDQSEQDQADRECQDSLLGRMGLILRRHEQVTMFGILIVCTLLLSSYFLHLHLSHDNIIDVDDLDYRAAAYAVDINTAQWPELANIPSIGEKLAKAIVAYRSEHGDFVQLDQLNDVPGIGPSKLKLLRQYSLPLPSTDNRQAAALHPQADSINSSSN